MDARDFPALARVHRPGVRSAAPRGIDIAFRDSYNWKIVMRRFPLLLTLAPLVFSGCITMQPFPIDAQAPKLGVHAENRLPLSAAVVIPDPMGMRMLFWADMFGKQRTDDRTSTKNGDAMYPAGRELAKISQDTFSQVFSQAAVVRRLPSPGEYDVVVKLTIPEAQVNQQVRNRWLPEDRVSVKITWAMSVLNRDNVEVLAKAGAESTAPELLPSKGFSMQPFLDLAARHSSRALEAIAREAAMAVASAAEVKTLAQAASKKP